MPKFVTTEEAPLAGGHYSQAVISNGLVFISGQVPIKPKTNEKVLGTIEEQTRQVLENVKAIAEGAGSSVTKIVKTTAFITDIALWKQVNEVYAEFFGEHRPARAIIPCKELHYGFLIEVEAIAEL